MRTARPIGLPGMEHLKTYAAHRCWKDATPAPVKFHPISKKAAAKIMYHARHFERLTLRTTMDAFGHIFSQGKLGRMGILVLHTLIYDFLNFRSGRLDPSIKAIAEKACVSVRSVYYALERLKKAGVLSWVQRCTAGLVDGRYVREQDTNAYGLSPVGQWKGYRAPPDAPPPDPESWGATPPMGSLGIQAGDSPQRMQMALDGQGGLGAALAALSRRRS